MGAIKLSNSLWGNEKHPDLQAQDVVQAVMSKLGQAERVGFKTTIALADLPIFKTG